MITTSKNSYNNRNEAAAARAGVMRESWERMLAGAERGIQTSVLVDSDETFGDIICALSELSTNVRNLFERDSYSWSMLRTKPLTLEADNLLITTDKVRWAYASMKGAAYNFRAEDVPVIFEEVDKSVYVADIRTKQSIPEILSLCNFGYDLEVNGNTWIRLLDGRAVFSKYVELSKCAIIEYRTTKERKKGMISASKLPSALAEQLHLFRWAGTARVPAKSDMLGLAMVVVLSNPTTTNLNALHEAITNRSVDAVKFDDFQIKIDTTTMPMEKRVANFWVDLIKLEVPCDIRESLVSAHGVNVDLALLELARVEVMDLLELRCEVEPFL